jgi:predicted Zn-dependent peptidase
MKEKKLENGINVVFEKTSTESVTVEVAVKVGSNYEDEKVGGISHFIEHLVFCGTEKRKNSRELTNEIEKLGGELNAATGNETTFFYIKIPKKHLKIALDVLSDILLNPLFREEDIEKERKIILDEINMINDEPRFYQWILFQQACFESRIGNPVYGTKESVKQIKKEDIVGFYKKYYISNNMYISIVGGCDEPFDMVDSFFKNFEKGELDKLSFEEQRLDEPLEKIEEKEVAQSYMVLGYPTVPKGHKDSVVFKIIKSILGRGQSGKLFDEIRNKRGLAYDVGAHDESGFGYGFFATYVNTEQKNIEKIKTLILNELDKLKEISEEEVDEAKTFLEGNFLINMEDTHKRATFINSWNLFGQAEEALNYLRKINEVTKEDIKRAVKQYFGENYTLIILKQK